MPSTDSLEPAELETALQALGDVPDYRQHSYELVLVGGVNLVLQGVIARPTKDADLVSADHWPTRGRHVQDLRALGPTAEETDHAADWCATHDQSPAFQDLLRAVLSALAEEAWDGR